MFNFERTEEIYQLIFKELIDEREYLNDDIVKEYENIETFNGENIENLHDPKRKQQLLFFFELVETNNEYSSDSSCIFNSSSNNFIDNRMELIISRVVYPDQLRELTIQYFFKKKDSKIPYLEKI